jgi:RHS repeat-associated protein
MPASRSSTRGGKSAPAASARPAGTGDALRRLNGQRLDGTGLVYYHARSYDPGLGRFLSADSVVPGAGALTLAPHDATAQAAWGQGGGGPANPQDLNRYAYGLNNPVRNTDPTGHCVEVVSCTLEGAAVGSVVPGAGTAAGAMVGFVIGAGLMIGAGALLAYGATHLQGYTVDAAGAPVPDDGAAAEAAGAAGPGNATDQRLVPNPDGRLGSPAHRQKVDEVARDVKSRGMTVEREFMVKTPGGHKERRFVDVAGLDPDTGELVELHQVGVVTKRGLPVAREREALEDLERAMGIPPVFHPYRGPR